MSDKDRQERQIVEAQPLKALPMPEYRFQDDSVLSGSLNHCLGEHTEKESDKIDLSGVSFNFS